MPYCRKCGSKIKEESRYCPKCGYDNQAQTLVPPKLELDVGPRVGEKMFPQVMKAWWFVALIFVIIFLVGILLMFNIFSKFPFLG